MKSVKAITAAIRAARGNIKLAARKLRIDRSRLYAHINNHPELKPIIEEARDGMLDEVESSLYEQAVGKRGTKAAPRVPACAIFILKTQGRKRGWVERNDLIPAVTVAQFIGEFTTAAVSAIPPDKQAEMQLTFKRIVAAHFAKLGGR